MDTIVIATNNAKKLYELRNILDGLNIKAISQSEAGIDIEVEETGSTFEENALLKAKAVCEASGLPTVADDSGLEVSALNGEPGVLSARYAGVGAKDKERYNLLLNNMNGVPEGQRQAKFVCAIAFCMPKGNSFTVRGECDGEITFEPSGTGGFGYDPVFYVKEFGCTFAQLKPEQKSSISHRGKALRLFKERLEKNIKDE